MMTSFETQCGTLKKAIRNGKQGVRARSVGVAAYHYHMLAQQQVCEGCVNASMKISMELCEYDEILEPRDVENRS